MTIPGAAPTLAACYRECARIHERNGRTYHLATRLLPRAARPGIDALYAFARVVDDVLDEPATDIAGRLGRLDGFEAALTRGLDTTSDDPRLPPVIRAVVDTTRRYDIDRTLFRDFLASMRMDLPGSPSYRDSYATLTELREYMWGSASVIGLQVLPVLDTRGPREDAEPYAALLGEAFQLTNFLRDVDEDLRRGRVYLPEETLAPFGVDRDLLAHCSRSGRCDRRVAAALAHLIALTRDVYRRAHPGIGLLAPRAGRCVRTAEVLYGGILDVIEDADYEIFGWRATVPARRRLAVAAPRLALAVLTPVTAPSPAPGA